MKNLSEVLSLLGLKVSLDESSSSLLIFASCVLIFSIISVLCFLNVLFNFIVLFISDNKVLLDKISKYKILVFMVKYYKNTSILIIITELLLYFFCMGSIIYFSLIVIMASV